MFGLEDKERLAASMRERVKVGEQVASKVGHILDSMCGQEWDGNSPLCGSCRTFHG